MSPQNHQNSSVLNFSTDSILGLSSSNESFNSSNSAINNSDNSGFELNNSLNISAMSSISSGKSTDPYIDSNDTQYKELYKSLKKSNDESIKERCVLTKNSENVGLLIIAPQHKQCNNTMISSEAKIETLQENLKSKYNDFLFLIN